MTLDTKNLNEEQIAEIQKQIDEIAAANKHELPRHLRTPKNGEGYCVLSSEGSIEGQFWDNYAIDIDRRDSGNASLDKAFLEFTNKQRRAYIKILRFIAENDMEIVDDPTDIGYGFGVDEDIVLFSKVNTPCFYNSIPKLKYIRDAVILRENCSDEILAVLSWYVPEVTK